MSGLWLKLGRGLVAPKARDDKTRGMTTPDEIASESKKTTVVSMSDKLPPAAAASTAEAAAFIGACPDHVRA